MTILSSVRIGNKPMGADLPGVLATDMAKLASRAVAQIKLRNPHVQAFRVGGHQLHGGRKWKKRSPKYAARMKAKGKNVLMVISGTLRNSQFVEVSQPKVGKTYRMTIYNETSYARYQQPVRPVISVTGQDVREFDEYFTKSLNRLMG